MSTSKGKADYERGPKESASNKRFNDRTWRQRRKWAASISSVGAKY